MMTPPSEAAEVLGLIPARGGSKGIPNKNIRVLAGIPLIGHTCRAASGSIISRTIVTTDSFDIAIAASQHGAEFPFLRPAHLAQDETPTIYAIHHALDWLAENENYHADVIVLLQPTAPLRSSTDIDACVQRLLNSNADSIVSVAPVPAHYSPHWQFVQTDGELEVFTGEGLSGIVPLRQLLEPTWVRNGAIYAFHRSCLERHGNIYGNKCLAYEMPAEQSVNLDTMEDWIEAERLIGGKKREPCSLTL